MSSLSVSAVSLGWPGSLQFMKPVVQEHCERAPGGGSNGGFQHTLIWNVRGREFRASGIGRSKKDAKKEAVKTLLVQLGSLSIQVSRKFASGHPLRF